MVLNHPPGHMQRTLAHFLSLGHCDVRANRMRRVFARPREAMLAAVAHRGLRLVQPQGAAPPSGRRHPMTSDRRRWRKSEGPPRAERAGSTLLYRSNAGRAVLPAGLFLDLGRTHPEGLHRIAAAMAKSGGR